MASSTGTVTKDASPLRPARHNALLLSIARYCLATVWIVAFAAKVTSLVELTAMVNAILPLPTLGAMILVILVLTAECIAGATLLFPATAGLGSALSLALGTVFIGVNLLRMAYGISVPCSCFGILYKGGPLQMLVIDGLICLGSAYVLKATTAYAKG